MLPPFRLYCKRSSFVDCTSIVGLQELVALTLLNASIEEMKIVNGASSNGVALEGTRV